MRKSLWEVVENMRDYFAEQVAMEISADGDVCTYEVYGVLDLNADLAAEVEDICETYWYAKPGTEPGTVVVDWSKVEDDVRRDM